GQYGIGRGSYQGYMQLPPPGGPPLPTGNPPDINIYLLHLIQLGVLKPNPNTYYAIHFAPNTGVPNQSTDKLYYGIVPDLTGCQQCSGSNDFEKQTLAASHELFEAITDPLPGNSFHDPLTNGEVADLCTGRTFYLYGQNINYAVNRVWSNVANACVD
ncbi:hypothetical protein HDU76_005305, partial [Blyttiomyces sp. JEL0837]